MESNFTESTETADRLRMLSADRGTLVSSAATPRTLLAGVGALAACWVASAADSNPGANYETPTWTWMIVALLFVLLHLIQRDTGVKFGSLGAPAIGAISMGVLLCLVLFSVSLALVSLDLAWAVMLTSLTAFVLVTWLAGVAYRAAVRHLRAAGLPHA
ncbi:hypothetical protein [Arthrobacter sp. zg-Y877]|uniref:hypothetical protein n=1 Tax=Arthrobacter sp. zg-Y877 TaxID=3049074 RepID=UPI0025A332F1|nr:hypothetical protein [Arthrobacter sp. zg-Y877]MDM7989120.1 hypothetical protein [Arthrobacter sp. zg-Y877]